MLSPALADPLQDHAFAHGFLAPSSLQGGITFPIIFHLVHTGTPSRITGVDLNEETFGWVLVV